MSSNNDAFGFSVVVLDGIVELIGGFFSLFENVFVFCDGLAVAVGFRMSSIPAKGSSSSSKPLKF
jgi:hypothetical protein